MAEQMTLAGAVEILRDTAAAGASKQLESARILQAIRDKRLFEQGGYPTFKEYIPDLLSQLDGVSWAGGRTLYKWLSFADVYLDSIELDPAVVQRANSHLQEALVLVDIDRKSGLPKDDTDKVGKLPSEAFGEVVSVLAYLVAAPKPAQKKEGLDAAATRQLLVGAGVSENAIDNFAKLIGRAPSEYPTLPGGRGWSVDHTKNWIKTFRGGNEEESAGGKVDRVWITSFADEERVEVDRLVLLRAGEELDSYTPSRRTYTAEEFAAVIGKDKTFSAEEYAKSAEGEDGFSDDE